MAGARRALASVALVAVAAVCACTGPSTPSDGGTTGSTQTPTPSSTSAAPPAPSTTTAATTTAAPTPSPTTTTSCAQTLVARLTPEQRVGQLIMVGAQAGQGAGGVVPVLRDQHVGGVALLGTWTGAATVRAATGQWQRTGTASDAGLGVLVAADQEGGQVQHLRGTGFTSTPSALVQGRSAQGAGQTAATVAGQLRAAGVTTALAPVADTVAASFAARNAPIGALQREYGTTPEAVSAAVAAVVPALQDHGVSATLKHFPGLGRVTGNTDLSADGTTDTTTTADDAYLGPFRTGIAAGADLVMVSSALYPKLDADHRAVFSPPIVSDLLRGKLGFAGVVISDDLGGAKSVASVPVGDRATQFVAAGGDVVLTGLSSTVPTMAAALRAKAAADPAFAAKVDAAARRVLDLKVRRGLAYC